MSALSLQYKSLERLLLCLCVCVDLPVGLQKEKQAVKMPPFTCRTAERQKCLIERMALSGTNCNGKHLTLTGRYETAG